MKMDTYQGDLPKILHLFLLIFQGKFQISCVVRNNYVKNEIEMPQANWASCGLNWKFEISDKVQIW